VTEPVTKNPIQFSVRSQLAVTTVLAVICAAFVLFGWQVLAFIDWILELAALAFLGTVAAYSRGYRRTFCAAAFFGAVVTLYFGMPRVSGLTMPRDYLILRPIVGFIAAAVSGAIAVVTRRFVERRGWHLADQEKK